MENCLTPELVLEQESRLYRAIRSGDIAELDQLLHDDLLFVLPDGRTVTKEEDLAAYRDGSLKVGELSPSLEKLNIIGDVAVVTLTKNLSGTFNDAPFELVYRYIRFWKKSDEGIKVVGGSATPI